LLKQPPGRFHGGQVLFALIFFSAFAKQSVLAPDTLDGHVRNGEIELSFQTGRSEGRQLLAQRQDLLLDLGRGLVWAMPMRTTVFAQPRGPALLKATQPLSHRRYGRGEVPGRGFDPVLTGMLH